MKLYCAVECNVGYGSMDRIFLEAWLITHGIDYKIGRRGDLMCNLTRSEIDSLRDEGWPVRVI